MLPEHYQLISGSESLSHRVRKTLSIGVYLLGWHLFYQVLFFCNYCSVWSGLVCFVFIFLLTISQYFYVDLLHVEGLDIDGIFYLSNMIVFFWGGLNYVINEAIKFYSQKGPSIGETLVSTELSVEYETVANIPIKWLRENMKTLS